MRGRTDCVLSVTPTEVLRGLERSALVLEFLAETAAQRVDPAGADAWRGVLEVVELAIAKVHAAKLVQTKKRQEALL